MSFWLYFLTFGSCFTILTISDKDSSVMVRERELLENGTTGWFEMQKHVISFFLLAFKASDAFYGDSLVGLVRSLSFFPRDCLS